jgi:hypothetical protein
MNFHPYRAQNSLKKPAFAVGCCARAYIILKLLPFFGA